MSVDEIRRVWVLTTADVSTAPGTTEPYYLVQHFSERWETHVFSPLSGEMESVQTHRVRGGSLMAVLLFNLVLAPYFVWQALRQPPDLVYSYRNVFLPAFICQLLTDATVVYDIRVDPYRQPKEFQEYEPQGYFFSLMLLITKRLHQFALPRADGVITLSEELSHRLTSEYGVPREKVGLVPLAADIDKFEPMSSDDERLRVAYVGAIRDFRGIEDLVKALASLEATLQTRVQLDLYGPADEAFVGSLEALAPDGPPIEWHGYIEHSRIAEEVASCDVAVSPLPPLDSFQVSSPAKIYEYLAMGLPVVATDITPHRRILDEDCGILVASDDVEMMTAAFEQILSDSEYRSRLSEGARQRALDNTWEERFATLCAYLDDWSG